jgi:hypothetical protein
MDTVDPWEELAWLERADIWTDMAKAFETHARLLLN